MCQEFCGRARGENNDNENNDSEAKKCYREALYLDPTYSSAQQSLTALETREARAADRGVAGARSCGAARGCGVGAWRRGTVVGYNKENYKVQWDGDGTVQTGCFALITPARGYRVRVIGDARR